MDTLMHATNVRIKGIQYALGYLLVQSNPLTFSGGSGKKIAINGRALLLGKKP